MDLLNPSAEALRAAGYALGALLGQGGSGSVYRARQLRTGQEVAIKVLRPLSEGPEARERRRARFRREMRLCAALHHPNVVRLLDSGELPDGLLYSVFAYVPGQDLAAKLRDEGALRVGLAARLMLQVLDALAAAHAAGVVHRDIKPQNIMISAEGARPNALVLDFGLGALSSEAVARDAWGEGQELLGTPAYASPEQLRGEAPTPRSDLYSWALVFVECLTGQPMVRGAHLDELLRQQLDPRPWTLPEPLRAHPLARLLHAALDREVVRRDVTAAGLHRELERVVGRFGQADDLGAVTDATARPPALADDGAPSLSLRLAGERRHVWTLCCVAELSGQVDAPTDAEAIDGLLRALQELFAEILARHDGQPTGTLGDRFLGCFGLPSASEDDGIRAARAALDLLAETGRRAERLSEGARLRLRLGLHCGPVTSQTRGAARPADLLGLTAAETAALAGRAEPDGVVVSTAAARVLERRFVLEPADGALRLRSERKAGLESLQDAPMVDRVGERAQLARRWREAAAGAGGALLILGAPGMGKSRLGAELRREVAGQGGRALELHCNQESRFSPFQPLVDLLVGLVEERRQATGEETAPALRALLDGLGISQDEVGPLLGALIGLPPEPGTRPLAPQQERALTVEAWARLLLGPGAPTLLVVEDLHWADASTLDVLGRLVPELPSKPVLMLLTAREAPEAPWLAEAGQVPLERLEEVDLAALLSLATGERGLSGAAREAVLARADGVPLFLLELARDAIEGRPTGPQDLAASLDIDVPAALRSALLARLDRLGDARATAQLAAALGGEFPLEQLAAAAEMPPEALDAHLELLLGSELLVRRRGTARVSYNFQHALVRDMAYATLPAAARRDLHGQIATRLLDALPGLGEARPDLMAWHFGRAERPREAVSWGLRAAGVALRRSAYPEALAQIGAAKRWLPALPEREADEAELDLNGMAAPALMATQGFGSEALVETLERSRALVEKLGDSDHALANLWGLATLELMRGRALVANSLAGRMEALATTREDWDRASAAAAMLAQGLVCRGELLEAEQAARRAITLYDMHSPRDQVFRLGHDAKMLALGVSQLTHLLAGRADTARSVLLAVREHIGLLEAPHLEAAWWFGSASCCRTLGDRAGVIEASDALRAHVAAHGYNFFLSLTELYRAWAERDLRGATELFQMLTLAGGSIGRSSLSLVLAEAALDAGDVDIALGVLGAALQEPDEASLYLVPELRRLRADALARQGSPEAAGQYREALKEARAMNAWLFEVRALLGLANVAVRGVDDGELAVTLMDVLGRASGEPVPELAMARDLLHRLEPPADQREHAIPR